MTTELVPLCTVDMQGGEVLSIGTTPAGRRMIGLAPAARWEGERLRANQRGMAADWLAIGPEGTGTIDARATLETDDGALIYVRYSGRAVLSRDAPPVFFTAPLFETGDERYRWLNRVQAVAKGSTDGKVIHYDVYELR